ncbi:MAG: organic solvent tolerance protein OstA [Mariniblastus sp.]|nr:organic solvent tolerance protein OstA [Mariniblastus sp.]
MRLVFFLVSLLMLQSILDLAGVQAKQISYPRPAAGTPISVSSGSITRWQAGQFEVLHLSQGALITQGPISASADEAIIYVESPEGGVGKDRSHKIIAYLEGNVVVQLDRKGPTHKSIGNSADQIVDDKWLGQFFTTGTVNLDRKGLKQDLDALPGIYDRSQAALSNGQESSVQFTGFTVPQETIVVSPQTGRIQQVQPKFQPPLIGPSTSQKPSVLLQGVASAQRNEAPQFNIQITGRDSSGDLNTRSAPNPNNPNERITTAVGGIRIVIDSPQIADAGPFRGDRDRKLYIVADNMVQWQTLLPDGSKRDQFYLEGNVIFSKGSRTIYSERMFYDATTRQGTILKAELTAKVPDFEGTVRLKADVVQQYDENNLQAFGSAFTSSQIGVPKYWIQSERMGLSGREVPVVDPDTMLQAMDPQTGLYSVEDEYVVDAQQNRVYVAGLPVFAWPRFRSSLGDPTLYLDRFGIGNDRIFGFQINTGWNMEQVLGLSKPTNGKREWIGIVDYLSDRGIGVGSEVDYEKDSFFRYQGKVKGNYRSWFINDQGNDNLGFGRTNIPPEKNPRGRIWLQHRQDLNTGTVVRAEIGYISDRNFLEQYYEVEWDTDKDHTTGFWLERNEGTQSKNLTVDFQLNGFFTQTSGVRAEHFVLGQPLFNNRAIWHSHSQAGYVKMKRASAPEDAEEIADFNFLAWETNVDNTDIRTYDGMKLGTRNELDFPVQIGPVKVVPYALGDLSYWQEDLQGNDLLRGYGQTGIRASLPIWRVDPSVQSVLWNVNGLAHKVSFDMDAFYSDSSQDMAELPLYDHLDDDSQEAFRRRFGVTTFGIPNMPIGENFIPTKFDERYFAMRSGMQGNVTAASSEIADDLAAVKFGVRQRWQTKRGMPGKQRIVDWITFDTQAILFPNASRDNNGADFGMFDYDFRWHIGDRFSLVSDGYFDFFSQGLRTASFGANFSRPEVGNLYLGYRMIEGPLSSNILSAAVTYRMSEKWGVKGGSQVDFGETGNIGESLNLIYIGESFLWQFGAIYDVSRDNLSFRFGFEPRFGSRPRLFRPGGKAIPPASSGWLE